MAFADLVRRTMDQAPGCPDPTAAEHVRAAAAEFCARTRCWRHVATVTVANEAAAAAIALTYPDGAWPHAGDAATLALAVIHEIEAAWLDDYPLTPARYGTFAPDELAAEGPAKFLTQVDPRRVALVPRQGGALRYNLFLKPSTEGRCTSLTPVLPAHITDQFGLILVSGALRTLLAAQGKSWTAPSLAAGHGAIFEDGLNRHFDVASRGQQRTPKRMTPRYF